jgi:hypothetical protein
MILAVVRMFTDYLRFGQVNYHCHFGPPTGWRGAIARMILRRELEVGPADSLLRLTRAAELLETKSEGN